MCYIKPEDSSFVDELRTMLKLNNLKQYSQDRRLQWFGHLGNWKRVPSLINVRPSRLVVVSVENNLWRLGIRY